MPIRTLFALLALAVAASPSDHDLLFEDATLRVDFLQVGHAAEEHLVLERLSRQGPWAGSRVNRIDPSPLGAYEVTVHEPKSGRVLFSRRWDGIFYEYKTTAPARRGVRRAISGSVCLPFPSSPVTLSFALRERGTGRRIELAAYPIDPADPGIFRGRSTPPGAEVMQVHLGGPPEHACDILFLSEGYTLEEREKFRADLTRMATALLAEEPFASLTWSLAIRGVFAPSAESGVTDPSKGIYRRTALGSSFGALGMDRYLLTEENRALQELAAAAPHDTLVVLANSTTFGGGGMYNVYALTTAGSRHAERILIHEIGHSLAGLADEYDQAPVTYEEIYPAGIEPLEPNVTALLDPLRLKWAHLADPNLALPTPWKRNPGEDLPGWRARLAAFLAKGSVGAFEGAAYRTSGLYRPAFTCVMRTLEGGVGYCRVCREAVAARIRLLSE